VSGGRARRSLFTKFTTVPNGIPVTGGSTLYKVEPLHAEILLAHNLAYQCGNPYCGDLHLYDDTFWCEVRAVLSVPPEDVDLLSDACAHDMPPHPVDS
jgi:hypothetical protein